MSSALDSASALIAFISCIGTVAAAVVTYLMLRASFVPEVVIYPESDPGRPSLILLVIKNIGKGPAYNVVFKSQKHIPAKAWGNETAEGAALPFQTGPIVTGIPYLPTGGYRIINWGQFAGLKAALNGELRVTVEFHARMPLGNTRVISNDCVLDVESFAATDATNREEVQIKSSALTDISKTLKAIQTGGIRIQPDPPNETDGTRTH